MIDFEFINEVAPEHGRTSCSDADWNGNQYFNEMGYPRCVRCCLLHRLAHGRWPHDAQFRVTGLRAVADFRKSDDMDLTKVCRDYAMKGAEGVFQGDR